jgi:diketogulonate reductase-like aldo/keto reductase
VFLKMVQISKTQPRSSSTTRNALKKRQCNVFNKILSLVLLFAIGFFGWERVRETPRLKNMRGSHAVDAHSITNIIQNGKPYLLYGTAWKEEQTARLVSEAIHTGFRFIDTACQPKHYQEPLVGEGWVNAATELGLAREDLFLQTKYTSKNGQDPNKVPYDVNAPIEEQVRQSVKVSLENLKTTYIDSLVMNSPFRDMGDTLKAYKVMESFVDEGKVHQLGISNCYDFQTFKTIYDEARIKPKVLQNRFYADSGFDIELRQFCKEHGILYQSFWTLTGNRAALNGKQVRRMAESKNLTPQTLMYAFMLSMNHTPLSGTTDMGHMAEDVAVMERIQGGEEILDENDMMEMSNLLGITAYE